MRTSDCDGASWALPCGSRTVTLLSSLPGRSNIVAPMAPSRSGSAGSSPPARATSASTWRSKSSGGRAMPESSWPLSPCGGASYRVTGAVMARAPHSIAAGGALAEVAVGGAGGGVGGLRQVLQAAGKHGASDVVGQVDQQWEAAL